MYVQSVLDRSLLSRSQHAYVKGKSVETALRDVTCFVEANLARGKYTLSPFLDIEGVFNNVTTSSIENSVIHAPDFLVPFITHLLGNRLIRSNLDRRSTIKRATGGTPLVALGCWIETSGK